MEAIDKNGPLFNATTGILVVSIDSNVLVIYIINLDLEFNLSNSLN